MNRRKRKSQKRFEQLNLLTDEIAPSLKTPSQVAVLMVCYRHARERGHFQVSNRRIAHSAKLGIRQVKRVMYQLERLRVIKLICEHKGPIPSRYQITGEILNGDMHDTIGECAPDVATQEDGDTGDR